jgi:hypothetical protein
MKRNIKKKLSFEVDKLTNSIENSVSGDVFRTEVSLLLKSDLLTINKKSGWEFNWKTEFESSNKEVYKLTILNNQQIIQGLISISFEDKFVRMNLLESAPFNRGKDKIYIGVPGNLVAFACKLSFQRGYDGYVSFIAKSKLINHYIDILGATHLGGNLMLINSDAAIKLTNKYFKD